jgi:N-terminal domain of galactosyltransferase
MERCSVVIPWWRRPEIGRTIPANAELFSRYAAEVIIVDCGHDPEELPALLDGCPPVAIRHILLPMPAFNKCLANNIGAFCSSAPLLFFCDADIELTASAFTESAVLLQADACFVQIHRVRESQPLLYDWHIAIREQIETRELVYRDGRRAILRSFAWDDGSRCGGGLLLMKRHDFTAVGGFNSALTRYGFEDHDLQLRLQLALGLKPVEAGDVLHLSHGDDVRNIRGASHDADQRANMAICIENYSRGELSGTYTRDIAEWGNRIRELEWTLSSR